MPGDRSKKARMNALQAEVNRQALVDIGKRLAQLEKKFWDLEREAKDVRYSSVNALNTAKRLQGIVAQIMKNRQSRKATQP